ncbi:MAG: serine/threonine protein kinase [Deltaproteobacteria bacterium]|nr:serine/threonine protein kinase [Deltaproteobacteria bacterium]
MGRFEPRPFGKYFLTERIAVGGMAEIYKAKTFGVDGFEKLLAIKKILSHYSSDKEFITMLTDEAKLVVHLSHANIVQVYDLGRVGDDYFISMELVDGVNLRQLGEKAKELNKPVPMDVVLYIASEVCKGLDYAHNKKGARGEPLHIVHRDVSPQNILVSFEGGVKLADFGIAKAAMNLSQTNIGILKGKVTYMAPEQAFGKPIDQRTDLFSLGICLYELVTGKRLFTGESQMEILKTIRNTHIDEAFLKNENAIPDFFKPVLAKTLAYKQKNRFESASDFQIELTKLLYQNFSDFTPRKLSETLQEWFGRKEIDDVPADMNATLDEPRESILVSSSLSPNLASQPAVVRDQDKEEWQKETLKAEDHIRPRQFHHGDQDEDSEVTEKSEVDELDEDEKTPLAVSVSELLEKKSLSNRRKNAMRAFVAIAFLTLVYLGVQYILPTPSSKRALKKKVPVVQEQQSNKTNSKQNAQEFFVQVSSIPEGARIFLNGDDLGLVTPATLEGLQSNRTFALALKLADHQIWNGVITKQLAGTQIMAELKALTNRGDNQD